MASPVIYDSSSWGGSTVSEDSPEAGDGAFNIGTVSAPGSVTVTFTGAGVTPAVRVGDTGANFTGQFISIPGIGPQDMGQLKINFTLTAQTVTPNNLSMYFKSGGNLWVSTANIDLFGLAVNSPTRYSMFIGTSSAWNLYAGSGTFINDYDNVSEFGFQLVGGNWYNQPQSYLFNDVYFSVPEPETVWMILVVLGSLAMTFKARLAGLAGQVRERFEA
jgi:hypothetical protein